MNLALVSIAMIFALTNLAKAEASLEYNDIGKRAYAAWDCAAYASLLEEKEEIGVQLFELGYDLHTKMIDALREGLLNDENTAQWPIAYRWYIVLGPSTDFSVGYMWAKFQEHAYDETWEGDLSGTFDELKKLQKAKAESEFRSKNCALLLPR